MRNISDEAAWLIFRQLPGIDAKLALLREQVQALPKQMEALDERLARKTRLGS